MPEFNDYLASKNKGLAREAAHDLRIKHQVFPFKESSLKNTVSFVMLTSDIVSEI